MPTHTRTHERVQTVVIKCKYFRGKKYQINVIIYNDDNDNC